MQKYNDLKNSHYHTEDQAIWLQVMQGNQLALVQLYDRYADTLYNYGKKITHQSELVEDAIQDLLAEIWYRREKLSVPCSVKAYLLRALRQKLLKQLLRYRRITLVGEYLPSGIADDEFSTSFTDATDVNPDPWADIHQAMASLSPKEQQAITLKYTENLSHDEIVNVMDIKKQTLYNLLHTALRKLTKSVKKRYSSDTVSTSFIWVLLLSKVVGLV